MRTRDSDRFLTTSCPSKHFSVTTKTFAYFITTDTMLQWRKGTFPGVTWSWSEWDLRWPDPGNASTGWLELSQVDSFREWLLEVRVRDLDLYSLSYMLYRLFLHLANGPAVIITILSGGKSYGLIVFLLKLFVRFLLRKLWEPKVGRLCKEGCWSCKSYISVLNAKNIGPIL